MRLFSIEKPVLKACEFSAIAGVMSTSEVLDYYDRLRGYVEHEDELINARLTWSFTVHGFLFAVYGLLWGKAADWFLQLHTPPAAHAAAEAAATASPDALERIIPFLFIAQIPIALLGALMGWYSLKAIFAAHRAIQHLDLIAEKSPALNLHCATAQVSGAIEKGSQTVPWPANDPLQPGTHLLVCSAEKRVEEVVEITAVTQAGVVATFSDAHPAGTLLTHSASAFLPRITRGGAESTKTDSARSYYFVLPFGAMCLWVGLLVLSVVFAFAWRHFLPPPPVH